MLNMLSSDAEELLDDSHLFTLLQRKFLLYIIGSVPLYIAWIELSDQTPVINKLGIKDIDNILQKKKRILYARKKTP